ncbi:MAG: hypothetical protein AB7U20_07675 [Planctomycetaceae bacterium]
MHRPRQGLTLVEVLVVAILFASTCVALRWYGMWKVVRGIQAAAVLLLFGFVWRRSYRRAPRSTAIATVIVCVGFVPAALAPSLLIHVREQARREQVRMRLWDLGRAVLRHDETHPIDPP